MTPEEKRRNAYLLRTYGITLEDLTAIVEYQDNACAVCHVKFTKTPHVDHDHRSGIVRGALCFYCNHKRVGRETSAQMAYAVADYLACPPAVAVLGRRVVPPKPKKKRRKVTK